ncbi:MAG: HAD-IC family P-type ATPase [Xanthomonadaceae bacterium]|nr:HAD-IC family P-type ATPase [Xanthomonadaceae bacterium]
MAERSEHWHALAAEQALQATDSSTGGLSGAEATRRLELHGPNALPAPARRGPLRRLADQFTNVLIGILTFAALVTLVLGHLVDAAVIASVIIVNAIVGFLQEGKAERALDAIRDLLSPKARVRREGEVIEVDATKLVRGDIVLLRSGDRVPADLRLIEVHNLRVDEAALTGESAAAGKQAAAVEPDSALGDRRSLAFAGTVVQVGRGTGVVFATASDTEVGRISTLLRSVDPLKTPLLVQIDRFARWLSAAILVLAIAVFAFGIAFRSYSVSEMFLAAVALAVAAIPEGLPAIITITLALGVQMMARRKAIVRRLPAVEALGAVTVICSDKTGTLTRGEMMVATVLTPSGSWTVDGSGYMPDGSIVAGVGENPDRDDLDGLLRAAILCNDSKVALHDGQPAVIGDATEAALKVLALKGGLDDTALLAACPRLGAIPFESEQRYMVTLHPGFALLKGAPEVVLPLCGVESGWFERVSACAARGQRMLALARRDGEVLDPRDGGRWTLLGVVGLIDPPRLEVAAAIAECRTAGIRVKMITGDHAQTAAAVAASIGIGGNGRVLTGADLDAIDDAALPAAVLDIDVFARVSPEHKLRLVNALQAAGEAVAMTGDGVNDAPALKRASVGVAMGRKGTEAARQAAEIVLADDNFASIAAAVAEGRRIYDNIRKAILFILPTNAGEALTVGVAIMAGRALPMTPVHVLWVNMVTAVTLALALVFERAERDVMQRPPRPPDAPILSPMLIQRTVLVGALMLIATFGTFALERAAGAPLDYARTAAVNALVMCEIFYLLNTRSLTAALTPANAFSGNIWVSVAVVSVLLLQLAFTYLPPLQRLFGTASLDADAWVRAVAAGFGVLLVVEAEKYIRRHK